MGRLHNDDEIRAILIAEVPESVRLGAKSTNQRKLRFPRMTH